MSVSYLVILSLIIVISLKVMTRQKKMGNAVGLKANTSKHLGAR